MANRTLDILTEKTVIVGTDIMPIQTGTEELNRISITKLFEAIPVPVNINSKLTITADQNIINLAFSDVQTGYIGAVKGVTDAWKIGTVDATANLTVQQLAGGIIRFIGGDVYVGEELGVGTFEPAAKLHVLGSAEATMIVESNATGSIQFKEAGVGIRGILGYSNGSGAISVNAGLGDMVLRAEVGKNLHFGIGGNTQAVISLNGYLGVNTITPEAMLDVNESTLSSTSIIHARVAGDANFQMVSGIGPDASSIIGGDTFRMGLKYKINDEWNSGIIFRRGGSVTGGYLSFMTDTWLEKMTLTSPGKVGIGNTNPVTKLHIVDTNAGGNTDNPFITLGYGSNAVYAGIGTRTDEDGGQIGLNFTTSRANVPAVKMTLNSHGNLGIGTKTPLTKLHLASTGPVALTIDADTDNLNEDDVPEIRMFQDGRLVEFIIGGVGSTVRYGRSMGNAMYLKAIDTGGGGGGSIQLVTGGVTIDGNDGSAAMTLLGSGLVGIGLNNPATHLHVNSAGANAVARFESTDDYAIIELKDNSTTSDEVLRRYHDITSIHTNGLQALTIIESGFIGIATAAPKTTLEVAGLAATTTGLPTYGGDIKINTYSTTLDAVGGLEFQGRGDASGYGSRIFHLSNSGDLVFEGRNASPVWTERMRIANSGRIGIHTTSPDALGLHVVSTGSIYNNVVSMVISDTTSRATLELRSDVNDVSELIFSGAGDYKWDFSSRGTSGGDNLSLYKGNGAQAWVTPPVLNVVASGNSLEVLGACVAASFDLSSDIRYKNVLETYKGDDIDFIRFNTDDDSRNRYGVSAQALQKIEPDLVDEDSDKKLKVRYIDFLVREVVKLNARIAKLEG